MNIYTSDSSITRRTALAATVAIGAAALAPSRAEAAGYVIYGPTNTTFNQVRAIQYLLLQQGFSTNWESSYGPSTTAAVMAFQRARRLQRRGLVDPLTFSYLAKPVSSGQTSYLVYALQSLLNNHGYVITLSTNFNAVTLRHLRSFQVNAALSPNTTVDLACWNALMAKPTRGPLYPMMQYQTGAAQWSNCGPVAMISLLLQQGITPHSWTGDVTQRRTAVEYMRYTTMGLANTAARNAHGTEFPDIQPAFAKYGVGVWHGGINDTIAQAKLGRPSIAGGDVFQMPYAKYASRPASHWLVVTGYIGGWYLVLDPLSETSDDYVHGISEAQLRKYAATNPGHPLSTAAHNSILLS